NKGIAVTVLGVTLSENPDMKTKGALAALTLVLLASAPAVAGDVFVVTGGVSQPSAPQYFSPSERVTPHTLGVAPIDGRYPRGASLTYGMNIPSGAGAPPPLHVFAIPRPYGLGEAAVPQASRSHDAKGRATHGA